MGVHVKRPMWRVFVPTTCVARIRSIAYYAPLWVFGIASFAILNKQCHYRATLMDEETATYDRIHRRAYVALPDGRMALVYPIVDTQTSFSRTVTAFLDACNPFP
eukprot:gene6015-4319_t